MERKFVQIKVLQWRREHERVGEEKEEIALQWRTKKKKKPLSFTGGHTLEVAQRVLTMEDRSTPRCMAKTMKFQ